MKNEFNDLIHEIIAFGGTIAYIDNPADSDFQNACQLFSLYLENRFSELKAKSHIASCKEDIKRVKCEIDKFSDLIALPDNSDDPYIQWTRNLFLHCEELQRHKLAVA